MSSACLNYYNTAPAKRNLLIAGTVAAVFAAGVAFGLVTTRASRGIFNDEPPVASATESADLQTNGTFGGSQSPSSMRPQSISLATFNVTSVPSPTVSPADVEPPTEDPSSLPALTINPSVYHFEGTPEYEGSVSLQPSFRQTSTTPSSSTPFQLKPSSPPTVLPTSFPTIDEGQSSGNGLRPIPPFLSGTLRPSSLPDILITNFPTTESTDSWTTDTLQPVPPFLSETLKPSSVATLSTPVEPSNVPWITSPANQPSPEKQPTPLIIPTPSPMQQITPSPRPTPRPSPRPTLSPTKEPTPQPTAQPTRQPTSWPTTEPTPQPTAQPTPSPTSQPSSRPTRFPTPFPTPLPVISTSSPFALDASEFEPIAPTSMPTPHPAPGRTSTPTTAQPTPTPTDWPTSEPTRTPTDSPTNLPTGSPTSSPTTAPATSYLVSVPPAAPLTQTVFCAISDVPFIDLERPAFQARVENLSDDCEFLIHLGGIKPDKQYCTAESYQFVRDTLRLSPKATFILMGENESRNCPNADKSTGVNLWRDHFLLLDKFWVHNLAVQYFDYSFHFIHKKTLFFGLNLGGTDPNVLNWNDHLLLLGEYVMEIMIENIPANAFGVVMMFHAVPSPDNELFFGPVMGFLRDSWLKHYPVLLLHGDGHQFIYSTTEFDDLPNVLEIQLRGGSAYKPLQISADPESHGTNLRSTFSTDWQ